MRVFTALLTLIVLSIAIPASAQPAPLRINEVMSSNSSTVADEDGDFEDWVEIANVGAVPINLNGYGLTDNPSKPFKWAFGNVVIQPSQYLMVWASSKNRALHTSWGISAGGETIVLTAPDGTTLDSVDTGVLRVGISRGRAAGATVPWPYFDQPTPGQPNTTQWYVGFATAPTISQPSGRYTSPFDITVNAASNDDLVTVTFDGRPPTAADQTAGSSWPITQTKVVRARAFRDGFIPSPIVTATYLMNDPTTLPIVSVVADPVTLFDPVTGLFSLGPDPGPGPYYPTANFRKDVEFPIHVAMFEPDGTTAFELDAGMEIQGGISRIFPKKSLRIEAKASYGASSIDHQVFPDKPTSSYQHLVLRSSSEDQFETLFRDAFAQTLTIGTTLDRQAYRPVVLFINDQYWGIYNLREPATEEFIEDTYGYDEDEIDVIEYDGLSYQVRAGTGDNFANLFSFVYHNDLAIPANYETLKTMLDIENALDYFTYEIYTANNDWPGNNIRYWRPRAAGGKWRFLLFDLDNGMRLKYLLHDTLAYATNDQPTGIDGSHNEPQHTLLLRSLMRNPEFVVEFIRRMDAMTNIIFAGPRVAALIQQMAWGIYSEMPRQIERWWTPLNFGMDLASWYNEVVEMWTFANWRPTVINYILSNDLNLPGRNALGVAVQGGGNVRVNSLIPESYPYYGTHVSQVPARLNAVPDAGYRFERWTGSVESTNPEILVDMTQIRSVTAIFVAETPNN
jgi:hypothetical protein